jgi:hypothetical protein
VAQDEEGLCAKKWLDFYSEFTDSDRVGCEITELCFIWAKNEELDFDLI